MRGIIFDFNGTLFWDSEMHMDAWRESSKELRGTPFSDEEMRKYMFGRTNELIIEYAIGKKPSAELVASYGDEKEELYRNMCRQKHCELAPGAVDLLDYLKDNNIPMTIATMSDKNNVDFYYEIFGLKKWFDIEKVVYANGIIPSKPAPDIYKIAASNIGLSPKDCIVVEDALSGIESAHAAGIDKIIAIASCEPVEYYQNIPGVSQIITNFNQIDRNNFIS